MRWPAILRPPSTSYELVSEDKDGNEGQFTAEVSRLNRQLWLWRLGTVTSWAVTVACLCALLLDRAGITSNRMTIEKYEKYEDITHEGDDAWDELLTPNEGFLIKEIDGVRQEWGISMFHQLHCLGMMRMSYQSFLLKERAVGFSEHGGDDKPDWNTTKEGLHDKFGHILHCYDYLRQNIICAADGTIEQPQIVDDRAVINGYWMTHKCGDSKRLYKLSEDSGFLTEEHRQIKLNGTSHHDHVHPMMESGHQPDGSENQPMGN